MSEYIEDPEAGLQSYKVSEAIVHRADSSDGSSTRGRHNHKASILIISNRREMDKLLDAAITQSGPDYYTLRPTKAPDAGNIEDDGISKVRRHLPPERSSNPQASTEIAEPAEEFDGEDSSTLTKAFAYPTPIPSCASASSAVDDSVCPSVPIFEDYMYPAQIQDCDFPSNLLAPPTPTLSPCEGLLGQTVDESVLSSVSLSKHDGGKDSTRSSSSKIHMCPYCSTVFTRHHNLKSHLLTHSHEKPYRCDTCEARFRRLMDLKRHTKLHTGEKPHTCPHCDRSFIHGDALAKHNKGYCAGKRPSMSSPDGDEKYRDPMSAQASAGPELKTEEFSRWVEVEPPSLLQAGATRVEVEPNVFFAASDFAGRGSRMTMTTPFVEKVKTEDGIGWTLKGNEILLSDNNLSLVESHILEELSELKTVSASLTMDWDLLGFMKSQYPDVENAKLGSVITLSGAVLHAQATTCSEYAQQTWPSHGLGVVMAFQSAIDSLMRPEITRKRRRSLEGASATGPKAKQLRASSTSRPTPSLEYNSQVLTGAAAPVYEQRERERIEGRQTSPNPAGKALGHLLGSQATDFDIEITVRPSLCTLDVRVRSDNPKTIAEIFQQAIWMGAALRVSRHERVQYSNFCLAGSGTVDWLGRSRFNVTFDTSELSNEEQSCWLPLFANPVIARGFPVPERQNGEQGLEVPLEIMAALGGARHVTEFEGGLVLKGQSAMFVPVKRHHQCIQWHLVRCGDDHRILYRELSNECPSRAMVEEVDHESLRNTRAILGWWRSAEIHLGTADAAYDSIDWSPAGETKRTGRFSGANVGFQTMMTGQLNFILGAKDGRLHFSQKGPFQRIVQCAEKSSVVVYDLQDRRAWFVPALDVMLHVIQTRHHITPYNSDGKRVDLSPADPGRHKCAAAEATALNQSRMLYERDVSAEKGYYFKDAILDIWSQIERLMEKEDSIEARPGLALHGTMQSKVPGWEYMSLVHEKNYRRKEVAVAKSSGGWVDLVNDIDALVLFGTGFGEIIRPESGLGSLCHQWRSLPKSKDYLAAGVPILELLYSEAGSRLSRKHLSTTHLQWHRGSTLFEQCCSKRPDHCECDRTQQIYHDSLFKTFGRVRPPGKLEENGCVVFGQAHHPFKPSKPPALRENVVHILPNTSIQDAEIADKISNRHDDILSPSPPVSLPPKCQELNGCAIWSPKRALSPLSSSDDLAQEEAVARKRRHRMCHSQTSDFNTCNGPNIGDDRTMLSDGCAIYPLEYQPILRYVEPSNGKRPGCTQTTCTAKAEYTPSHAPKTLRHKARIENYSHHGGCSCTTCSTASFEPLDSMELVSIVNSTRRSSTNIAEMPNRQLA